MHRKNHAIRGIAYSFSVKYGTNSLVVVEKTSNNFIYKEKRVLGDVSYSNAPLILAKNKIFANLIPPPPLLFAFGEGGFCPSIRYYTSKDSPQAFVV